MSASGRWILLSATVAIIFAGACNRNPEVAKKKFFKSGQQYLQQAKYAEAQIQFHNAVKLDPKFVDAQLGLAKANLTLAKWNEASVALQKVLELDPSRVEAHVALGRLYLANRNYDKTKREADDALQRDPNDAAAHDLLGALFLARGDYAHANEAFLRETELLPSSVSALVSLALTEAALRRSDEAEQHLLKAISLDPTSPLAYVGLARLYVTKGQTSRAIEILRKGGVANDKADDLYLLRAQIAFSSGNPDEADAALQQLRDRMPAAANVAMAIGDFYAGHENSERAVAEYQRGINIDAKNVKLKERLTDLYLDDANQLTMAASLNEEVLKENPRDLIAHIQRGRILAARGKVDEAITELRKQVAEAPDSAIAHYALGLAYVQNGQRLQAEAEFESALKYAPTMIAVYRGLAELHLEMGNLPLTKSYAERALKIAPGDGHSHILLGEVFMRNHNFTAAREQFNLALKAKPNDALPHVGLAKSLVAEKNYSLAEKEFEAALQLNPRSRVALGEYTDYLVKRDRRAQAIAYLTRYLAAHPDDLPGHLILSSVLASSGQYNEAKLEAQRALQSNPGSVDAYLQLGRVCEQAGQIDAAIAAYQNALSQRPKMMAVQTQVGGLYYQKGDMASARKYYEQAEAIDPDSPVAAGNLAYLYAVDGGNLDVALGLAQKAKHLMPNNLSIDDTLAWVYYRRGNYASALPLLKQCVQKSPESGTFHYHLGMTLLCMGDRKGGNAELQHALRLKLSASEAQQARQALLDN